MVAGGRKGLVIHVEWAVLSLYAVVLGLSIKHRMIEVEMSELAKADACLLMSQILFTPKKQVRSAPFHFRVSSSDATILFSVGQLHILR